MGAFDFDLSRLSEAERLELVVRLEAEAKRKAESSFAEFFRQAWPTLEPSTPLVWNWHMQVICEYLQALWERRLAGGCPRLIINVPPGTSKSLMVSVAWPAWIWIQDAGQRVLSSSNDGSLVSRDTQKMRFLVLSEWYQERWGDLVKVDPTQREKTHFATSKLGFRQGVPIKGAVTGKRGDVLLIDDPHDAKKSFSDKDTAAVLAAYDQGLSTRVNNAEQSLRVVIMQRLRTNDLTGHLLAKSKQRWVNLCIPMEADPDRMSWNPAQDLGPAYAHLADPRTKPGMLLDPLRFPATSVAQLKEDLGEYGAAGQLQQRPTPAGGGILKRRWWKVWGREGWTKGRNLPQVKHVFASWDTAFSEADMTQSAFSAMTLWGIFWDEQRGRDALILLSAWWDRVDYPDLQAKAQQVSRERLTGDGDAHLIEKKASGISLAQSLRRNPRIRVRTVTPGPGEDKVSRAYLSQPLLQAGCVYVADTEKLETAVNLIAEFPAGGPPCADLTDTATQAIQYLQRGWWLTHPDDDPGAEAIDRTSDDEDGDQVEQKRRIGYG